MSFMADKKPNNVFNNSSLVEDEDRTSSTYFTITQKLVQAEVKEVQKELTEEKKKISALKKEMGELNLNYQDNLEKVKQEMKVIRQKVDRQEFLKQLNSFIDTKCAGFSSFNIHGNLITYEG